jgi:hypothetical protein
MRRHAVVLGLTFVALAAVAVWAGWVFFAGASHGSEWRLIGPYWPYLAAGCMTFAALAGVLVWLAFYSASHGYDDRIDPEGH